MEISVGIRNVLLFVFLCTVIQSISWARTHYADSSTHLVDATHIDDTDLVKNSSGTLKLASIQQTIIKSTPEQIQGEVIEWISDYFGVPNKHISKSTDLIKDLHANPMDVLEVVAMICENFGVDPPKRDDLTTVAQIADYVRYGNRVSKLSRQPGTRGIYPQNQADEARDSSGLSRAAKDNRIYIQTIFYATDRKLDESYQYSGVRALRGNVSYGICKVSIPVEVHTRGHLESPSILKFEWEEDPKKHIVLQKVEQLPWAAFLNKLNRKLSVSSGDAFVFIHGYNVSFDKAARRTAQIAYDLDFSGAPIFFSWPSDGSLVRYFSDREDVEWSVPHIDKFLRDLKRQAKTKQLHLIAHSMGNQGLIRALYTIALRNGSPSTPLFENIILAAPDFDAQVFTDQLAPEIISLANRWTLYASEKDIALDASTALAARRLGLPVSVVSGVDTVDATGIEVSPWSVPEFHSYYASKLRVIKDLIGVLTGLAPIERKLKKQSLGTLVYWQM